MVAGPLMLLLFSGCVATRKFVRNTTAPLEAKLSKVNTKVDKKTSQNAEAIKDLDQKTETGISEAQNSADQANSEAKKANTRAVAANHLAQKGVTKANQAQETANNIDNYKPSQRETVLFAINKATLTPADVQRLNQVVNTVSSLKHYVIEVKGYTSKTGPREFNMKLSRRRANTVIRYLTSNGKVPLVRIYSMGYGEANPVAPNSTRNGRKLNRRVDITVMVPQIPTVQNAEANSPMGTSNATGTSSSADLNQ